MEGAKTPMGNAGSLRPRRPSKEGMLKPRRPVVTHAWSTSCGPRRLKSRPMESEVPEMEINILIVIEPK